MDKSVDLSILALRSCVALVSPWLWFDMRFTRQFPVYYCCVQAVPDKINQCLWIIAGEYLRRWSVAECVYPGLFTRAVRCPCDMSNTLQKLPLTTDPGPRWSCVSVLVLAESWMERMAVMIPDLWRRPWSACGETLSGPKPNFHWKIDEANVLWAKRWTLSFLFLSLLVF